MKKEEKFVVITCVSMHRNRYCVPVSELQKLNEEFDITEDTGKQIEWTKDLVVCDDVKTFSTSYIDENIVDAEILSQTEILERHSAENEVSACLFSEKERLEQILNWKS